MSNCLITTPIYYVNSDPHIGHAYTNIISNCINVWYKSNNYNTFLLTGTDEHGQKVQNSSEKQNIKTQDFVDYYAEKFKTLADKLEINYDDFIRTTENRHKIVVQKIWKLLERNNYIYLGNYEGWYSISDEAFYDENEIIDGKAPNGSDVIWRKEESYFFTLSRFQEQLLNFYKENPNFIIPESRKNEIVNFVKSGLRDLSISRTNFTWGVQVPNNHNHVIYVWIDALTNYISALGFNDYNDENYNKFWKNSKKIHVIGKDILRFHAIYWPAILMACDLPLPDQLITHGWWTKDGKKISKSIGNTIDPIELINKFGTEYVKYFFLTNNNIFMDGDYEEKKFIDKINNELVNNFGNLISRTTQMIEKYFGGMVIKKNNHDYENILITKNSFIHNYTKAMNEYRFDTASSEIINFSSIANKFLHDKQPWIVIQDIELQSSVNDVLFIAIEIIRIISITLYPFIPNKSKLILDNLGIKDIYFSNLYEEVNEYKSIKKLNIFNKL